jgi:hypothetical protein
MTLTTGSAHGLTYTPVIQRTAKLLCAVRWFGLLGYLGNRRVAWQRVPHLVDSVYDNVYDLHDDHLNHGNHLLVL